MSKPRKRPVDREGPVQEAIVSYLRRVMPKAIVHHCKNEINKSGWAIAKEQARATKLGAVAGFPDLIVLPYATAGICLFEVKSERGRISDAQKDLHEKLRNLGYRVAVVRSIDDVRACLIEWGIGFIEKVEMRGVVT